MPSPSITEIDKNFLSEGLSGHDLEFHDITKPPFQLSGLAWYDKDKEFCRIPQAILDEVNPGVKVLAWHTSGVQVRFKTDASTIGIIADYIGWGDMNHMPRTGNSGFDLYVGTGSEKRFVKNVVPGANEDTLQSLVHTTDKGMQEYTLYFPLYNGVKRVLLGLTPGATIEAPTPFTIEKPVVFYGSSITQGGCTSRPGNNFTHYITRWLDSDMLNFGFSGSARGETVMAEALAQLDMSVFVLDYDHNAPSLEHFEETHQVFFKVIREKHPDLPVVFVSKPDYDTNPAQSEERIAVIRRTYEEARAEGDKNVYFVHGKTLFGQNDRDACTVDGCHPNDLGFYRMAEGIYPAVKEALGI